MKDEKESPAVKLARETIENYIRYKKIISPSKDIPDELKKLAGTFVSIKKHGELRGCIGTIFHTQKTVAEEIIRNAISSATQDPRFLPIHSSELDELTYSVDILDEPERVFNMEALDPKKYGVIVKKGERRGVLLPDLEGIDTPEHQISIAKRKAGIYPDEENVEIYRFSVKRYKSKGGEENE